MHLSSVWGCLRVCGSCRGFLCVSAVLALLSGVLCSNVPLLSREHGAERDVYMSVGSPVSVPCSGVEGMEVEWRLNGSVFQPGPNLTLLNTSLEDRGSYTCHSPTGHLLQRLNLHLGYPPSRPAVQCWSPSYPIKVLCSWMEQPQTLLPTHYIASYSGKEETQQCHPTPGSPVSPPSSKRSSLGSEWYCVMEDMELYTSYLINVTAINPLGRASHLQRLTMEDIVKPDPPVNVKVVLGASRKLSLEWAPPSSWPDSPILPLKYRVKYHWNKSGTSQELGPYESTQVSLRGLAPGRTYQVQVCAMDLLDMGKCSEWSTPVSVTIPTH